MPDRHGNLAYCTCFHISHRVQAISSMLLVANLLALHSLKSFLQPPSISAKAHPMSFQRFSQCPYSTRTYELAQEFTMYTFLIESHNAHVYHNAAESNLGGEKLKSP
uniref:Putative ovule protein n=1 Tax=Solanum chacoense TaxID=4108 RepID=A0A0V0HEJ8_SOLCH